VAVIKGCLTDFEKPGGLFDSTADVKIDRREIYYFAFSLE
jgi:hypothetical protein